MRLKVDSKLDIFEDGVYLIPNGEMRFFFLKVFPTRFIKEFSLKICFNMNGIVNELDNVVSLFISCYAMKYAQNSSYMVIDFLVKQ